MKNLSFSLFFAIFTLQVKSSVVPNPRALVDEVKEQLDELRNTVTGNIMRAQDDLGLMQDEFLANSMNVHSAGSIAIDKQAMSIAERFQMVLDLAEYGYHKNVSACTDGPGAVLLVMDEARIDQLTACVDGINQQQSDIVAEIVYVVDILINNVDNYEFQINRCNGNEQCILPLITQIELDKVRIPENIRTQVDAGDSLLTTLRVSVQDCSDTHLSEYVAEATALFLDINACVNRLLAQPDF